VLQRDARIGVMRLYNLIRYCSARGIGPSLINDKTFEDYWRYRSETTALA